MSTMISVASGFQYSVNIGYDLNNEDKIKNFIPTSSALNLLEEILLSTAASSTERSRVLIGAYGKGKSHIMLMILSMLLKKDIVLFEKSISRIKDNSKLYQNILNYYESDNKILPVIISGSNTSLSQAFILALKRTLSEHNMLDIMPETNYKAAVAVINRWEIEFPDTFNKFEETIDIPVDIFVEKLSNFNVEIYEQFERIYPLLTAGSVFNPFLGFDVVELYENVAKGIIAKGYSGLYIIYDEFSKFLEANISAASVSDTKMLQDFAEKCNRSGSLQMHIMLISHKEIANYIDMLPKQKVDGWRGVSERFLHVHLNNNFVQTYEIIEAVIQKDQAAWTSFCSVHDKELQNIQSRYIGHQIFAGMNDDRIIRTIMGCYPLHPVSTFVLPRLSERVAQNERTLFTFLSANGMATLPAFLDNYDDRHFEVLTPDCIYDYFEPLFRKEVYSGSLHANYILTEIILEQLNGKVLESKIVKTISLMYILEQFEKLKPTKEELVGIFSTTYKYEDIEAAINNLVGQEYVVYLKRSNEYLQLKQSSGVDVRQKINDAVEAQKGRIAVNVALNEANFDNYLYPSRYNDVHEMIRYFAFEFVTESEINTEEDWNRRVKTINADGVVFGIVPDVKTDISVLKNKLIDISTSVDRAVFIIPKYYTKIEEFVREFHAVSVLKNQALEDKILFDEYEVIYEDLQDLITGYISIFTHPEQYKATYIFNGKEQNIIRKAALTELLSTICDQAYSMTPIVNNEALNRNKATSMARNSRNKVVAALLRTELEENLGLSGTGQEVSIMRSTLVRTGIYVNDKEFIKLDLSPPKDPLIANMLGVIVSFLQSARENSSIGFEKLYEALCSPDGKIGLRRELIPIYLAAVMHEYKQEIIISDRLGQVPLTVDTLLQINAAPEKYSVSYLEWDLEKINFIRNMEELFSEHIVDVEKNTNIYDYIISAVKRWYMSLPKYSKEIKKKPDGSGVDKGYMSFIKILRQNPTGQELLFKDFPHIFGYNEFNISVYDNIRCAKQFFDNASKVLKEELKGKLRSIFISHRIKQNIERMSLTSIIKDWCDSLDQGVYEQIFANGTDRCLSMFKTITNDEDSFIDRLAKVIMDLRLEDWDDNTLENCVMKIEQYKSTAESFVSAVSKTNLDDAHETSSGYQVTFVDIDGIAEVKRFDRVQTSGKARLLLNRLTADIDSFGQAISEAEKRQIVMEVLKNLC